MIIGNSLYRAWPAAVAAAALAGCGSQQTSVTAFPQTAAFTGHSWMKANTGSQDLLYVSGGCGGVCVFSYPRGKLVGELSDPHAVGECVDKAGDVFIVNYESTSGSGYIVEYAHGGSSPIATLQDPGYDPQSCSVDPVTGNLAVTNGGTPGKLAIYVGAQGYPVDYEDPHADYLGFCSYDDKGNLFIDGDSAGQGLYELDEMPNGSDNFRRIKVDRTLGYPYDIQWDGKYLAVAASQTVIYHMAISGSKGTMIGSTVLDGPKSIIETEFWIRKGTIVMPYGKGDLPDRIGFWKYPTGGLMAKQARIRKSRSELFGTVVSPAAVH